MDTWQSGASYERYVGRWSRLVAPVFLHWLDVSRRQRWLDAGCGTGVLTETILREVSPERVTGVDSSPGFAGHARERLRDGRAAFVVGDALSLPFSDARFSAIVCGLALNFFPNYEQALAEMVRTCVPGGWVGAYVWDYAGEMQMMRVFWDAVVELEGSDERDEGRRFPICRPGPLAALFTGAGLAGVEVQAIDIATPFRDFDDYWQPFLGGQGAGPGYVATLTEERKAVLRESVRSRLRFEQDGRIAMTARAWAVRGRKGRG